MSTSFLFPTGTAVQMLGLSLLIGGMLALGAFTAPVLFRTFPRLEAGEAMTVMFRRYDIVLLAGLGMILVGEALRLVATGVPSIGFLAGLRYGTMAALTGLMLFSVFNINAQIEAMQKAGVRHGASEESKKFTATHQLSEKLYKIEMSAAVLILLLTPFV